MVAKDQAATRIGMPMDEFIRAFAEEGPFELIEGERVPIMPNVSEHSEIIKLIYDTLRDFEKSYGLIRLYSESTFALTDGLDWVRGSRIPDLLIYRADRITNYKDETPDWRHKPFVLVPDLCIEIVSPNDKYSDVETKVLRYLNDGVRVVWVALPAFTEVRVYRQGSDHITRLTADDKIEEAELLSGFSVNVRSIFPE